MNTNDWMRGANDAREGNEHKSGQSEDYNQAYAAQYEFDQIRSHFSEIE